MTGFSHAPARPVSKVCPERLAVGARNLLVGCAGLQAGQSVLIVHEDPRLGWYDAAAPAAVADEARRLGIAVWTEEVPGPADGPPPDLAGAAALHDAIIFFARIGDQVRFCEKASDHVCLVSYARTAAELASEYGTRDHAAMLALKDRADLALQGADGIEITCPLGTRVTGTPVRRQTAPPDVTVRRFPMAVPAPVEAEGFSGTVALTGFLTPTGSKVYQPAWLELDCLVMAEMHGGRITGFDGPREMVARIEDHYRTVAAQFSIDPWTVHSWHPGLHDANRFAGRAEDNPDLWSNSVFAHPRWLHFHTCGAYPPGEICWMVRDATVQADGRVLWSEGQIDLDQDRP